MKATCRATTPTWRARQTTVGELLRHATVVTDPSKLAYLHAEFAKKRNTVEGETLRKGRRPGAYDSGSASRV